jgi:hypothetical protein
MIHVSKGKPIAQVDRDRLRALLDAKGERAVLQALPVSRIALYRALAGLPVYPGTHALVRHHLDHSEGPLSA